MSDPITTEAASEMQERNASLWSDAWHNLRRNPIFVISALVIVLVASMAAFPWLWTDLRPEDCNIDDFRQLPSAGHWFGTDQYGCDYYAHAVYGARPSMMIAFIGTAGITVVGTIIGMLAGYLGGWADAVISRIVDTFLAFPFLVGALVSLSVLRQHPASSTKYGQIFIIAFVLIAFGWVGIARIMRGNVLATKNLEYVQAAKALGASHRRIMFRHIMPNAIAPVIVVATIALGGFVAAEATLTFLGVGLQQPNTSWGIMITVHQSWDIGTHWNLLLFPCGLLVATVLSFILAGDALRDALDPKLR